MHDGLLLLEDRSRGMDVTRKTFKEDSVYRQVLLRDYTSGVTSILFI